MGPNCRMPPNRRLMRQLIRMAKPRPPKRPTSPIKSRGPTNGRPSKSTVKSQVKSAKPKLATKLPAQAQSRQARPHALNASFLAFLASQPDTPVAIVGQSGPLPPGMTLLKAVRRSLTSIGLAKHMMQAVKDDQGKPMVLLAFSSAADCALAQQAFNGKSSRASLLGLKFQFQAFLP